MTPTLLTTSSAPEPGPGGATATTPLAKSYDPPVRGPVLLATDGRSATDATLRAAQAIAQRLGTTVEVIGVLEPFPGYLTAPEVPVLPPDVEEARRTAIRAAIHERLAVLGGGAEQWPVSIMYGEPGRTVAALARQRDSSAIVVGAGRHARSDRIFGGERALRVVRAAKCPVVAVRADFRELPKTVVVGIDFSPASVRAARAALLMLGKEGRIVLVHVAPVIELPTVPPTRVMRDSGFETLVSRWREEEAASTARLFEQLRDELRPYVPAGVTVETRTRSGAVLSHLLGVADDVGADMLAVGTHGPGVIERFFVGSVATDALREAGRTVLVAPSPNPVEAARLELRLRGSIEMTKADDWEPALEQFSKRNAGRPVRLEVDDPDFGAQTQEFGYALLGVSYDRHDRRVEIMVGDPTDRVRHLTRTIPRVDEVAFYATPKGGERALRIASGRGQTLVTFVD